MPSTDERRLVLEQAAEIIAKEIAPNAAAVDRSEEFPVETIKKIGRLGMLGIPYPEAYGGLGLDYSAYVTVISEIAKVCASSAMTVVAHTTLTGYPLFRFGTEDQKATFLSRLATGAALGAYALTEPCAGSDISGIKTTAVANGDRFVLNGSKIFITNANYADIFIVAAKTSPEQGAMGMSVFVVEAGTEGFRASGKRERKLGMRGSDTGELVFDDAVVPKENLIGKKNFGLRVLHETLVTARIGMAAIALGIAEGALGHCLQYVKERQQFGQSLSHFQTIKNMIADMEMNISAARLLVREAADRKDQGLGVVKAASEAKLFASETATRVTKDAIQIFGGYGYSQEYPLERLFRDAKLTEIGDGTSEMQRLIIADEVLKHGG